jgi:uncharacterized protein
MSRVVHFEVPVKNGEAARKFYGNVLGWQFTKWEGPEEYWLITTGEKEIPGIDGAFYTPGPEMSGIVNTVDVENLDEALAKVKANGGQMASPINHIPGVGTMAYVKDPEGNTFGMMQRDPNAMM